MRGTIYNEHFKFRESPFELTPNPRFFYLNPIYQEALATLTYGVESRRGFIVVTGETGTGKTTLLRRVMRSLDPRVKTAYVFNTAVNFPDLLRSILTDFGLLVSDKKTMMIGQLNEFLLKQHQEENVVAVLIDEAQDLGLAVLEELRLLTNLETDTHKLIQIVLVGQPSLEDKLNEPQLRQLRQRVALRFRLASLGAHEVGFYMAARLQVVAQNTEDLFDHRAVEKIARYSDGIPRLINVICDNALLLCYATSKSRIDEKMIDEVARDLCLGQARPPKPVMKERSAGNGLLSVHEKEAYGTRTAHSLSSADTRSQFYDHSHYRWPQYGVMIAFTLLVLGGVILANLSTPLGRISANTEKSTASNDNEQVKVSQMTSQLDAAMFQTRLPFPAGQSGPDPESPIGTPNRSPTIAKAERAKGLVRQSTDALVQGTNSIQHFLVVGSSFVRNKPSANAEIITALQPGVRIIVRHQGDYYWIRSIGDKPIQGYVHREDAFFERSG